MSKIALSINFIALFTTLAEAAHGTPFDGEHVADINGDLLSIYSSQTNELGKAAHETFSGPAYRHDLYSWSAPLSGDKDYSFGIDFKGYPADNWSYINAYATIHLSNELPHHISIISPLSGRIAYSSTSSLAFTHIAGFDVPLYFPEKVVINVSLKDLVPAIYMPCEINESICHKDELFKDFGRIDLYLGFTTLTPAPEPQITALCMAGMAVIGAWGVHRRKFAPPGKTMFPTLPDNG